MISFSVITWFFQHLPVPQPSIWYANSLWIQQSADEDMPELPVYHVTRFALVEFLDWDIQWEADLVKTYWHLNKFIIILQTVFCMCFCDSFLLSLYIQILFKIYTRDPIGSIGASSSQRWQRFITLLLHNWFNTGLKDSNRQHYKNVLSFAFPWEKISIFHSNLPRVCSQNPNTLCRYLKFVVEHETNLLGSRHYYLQFAT